MRQHATLVPLLLAAAFAAPGCSAGRAAEGPVALSAPRDVLQDRPGALEEAVDAARVVCVGESHDQRAHHEFQLDVLRRMAAQPGPLLLGMEMFQRAAQPHLDAYVAGQIDELEMLRRTEYFTRWGFDHTLYAPLWRYCRERRIRVVALNAKDEVRRKVGREGLDALTPEERAQIAKDVDVNVPSHRLRILGTIGTPQGGSGAHGVMDPARLERMYTVMVVWDETMAESAANALAAAGPRSRMLVAAGVGHIGGYDGIPDRITKRMPGVRPLVIACAVDEGTDEPDPWSHARFTVRFPASQEEPAPKLGVKLRDGSAVVEEVTADGPAQRAGLTAGDTLLRIGRKKGKFDEIQDVAALRYVVSEIWHGGLETVRLVWRKANGETVHKSIDLAPPAGT